MEICYFSGSSRVFCSSSSLHKRQEQYEYEYVNTLSSQLISATLYTHTAGETHAFAIFKDEDFFRPQDEDALAQTRRGERSAPGDKLEKLQIQEARARSCSPPACQPANAITAHFSVYFHLHMAANKIFKIEFCF